MDTIQQLYVLLNNLLYTTVRLNTLDDDGVGTCFFYHHFFDPVHYFPYLVTNKHVIEECNLAEVTFHIGPLDDDGKPTNTCELVIDNLQERFRYHPEPEVDLCVLPLPW